MVEKNIARQHVIARLLTGAVYHDDDGYWQMLTDEKLSFASYFAEMGVRLEVDAEMGMGFLRPMNQEEEEEFATAGYAPLPKIIPPKTLGYLPSLMCALLREALQHHEENSLESKHLYLDETQLIGLMRPYLSETQDDKALKREIRKVITRVEEISVLHRLPNRSEVIYRVEPIVRARIPLKQLQELLSRLKEISKGGALAEENGDELEKEQP
ncbi:MAG TPA: DUF4194 domain-containing protein [Verrucomicrobiae bacterium]|jgi:hypothetical protein|nr:DUF4194 domain-containing protein [Verrucomicrobiae bacterium]